MQRLGILASLILLSAAILGPVGLSFAESSDNSTASGESAPIEPVKESVQGNSTAQSVENPTPMPTMTAPKATTTKPLTEEEKIRKKIADELARLREKYNMKTKMLKEKLQEKAKAQEIKSALDQDKAAKMKTKFDEKMAKKATTFAERQEAAKKKFDEQMKKRYESFEHKVKQ